MKSILLLFTFLLISCQSKKESPIEIPKKQVESILQKIFVKDYPLYTHNQLVQDKAIKVFENKIDSLVIINGLEDIPLKILSIDKNPKGKGAIVQFYSDPDEVFNSHNLSRCLQVGFIGLMSEKLATKLTTNSKVLIRGHNYKRLSQYEVDLFYNQTYYGAVVKVDGKPTFNAGIFMVEVDKFKFL